MGGIIVLCLPSEVNVNILLVIVEPGVLLLSHHRLLFVVLIIIVLLLLLLSDVHLVKVLTIVHVYLRLLILRSLWVHVVVLTVHDWCWHAHVHIGIHSGRWHTHVNADILSRERLGVHSVVRKSEISNFEHLRAPVWWSSDNSVVHWRRRDETDWYCDFRHARTANASFMLRRDVQRVFTVNESASSRRLNDRISVTLEWNFHNSVILLNCSLSRANTSKLAWLNCSCNAKLSAVVWMQRQSLDKVTVEALDLEIALGVVDFCEDSRSLAWQVAVTLKSTLDMWFTLRDAAPGRRL